MLTALKVSLHLVLLVVGARNGLLRMVLQDVLLEILESALKGPTYEILVNSKRQEFSKENTGYHLVGKEHALPGFFYELANFRVL